MKRFAALIMAFALAIGLLFLVDHKKPQSVEPQQKKAEPPISFEQAKAAITETEVRKHLNYLTAANLQGRMSGMTGNRTAADHLIQWMKDSHVQPGIQGSYTQSFPVTRQNETKEKSTGESANIIGVLPGNDPSFKEECIVIGAHFDHIGWGPAMSQAPNRREVHPGADDNASGTCVVISCIKGFGMLHGQNKRTIVFIHFSGEEMGLVGARHYCANPVYPLNKTLVMVNQDMVGRLRNQTTLTAAGAAANPAITKIVQGLKGYRFQMRPTGGTGGGSDHAAFAAKGVPVIMFHTGQHREYHTPDDTADRIDVPGLHQICQAVFELCWQIDKIPGHAAQVFYGNISFDPDHK